MGSLSVSEKHNLDHKSSVLSLNFHHLIDFATNNRAIIIRQIFEQILIMGQLSILIKLIKLEQ